MVDHTERVLLVNEAARRLMGHAELIGTPLLEEAGLPEAVVSALREAVHGDPAQHHRRGFFVDRLELDVHAAPALARDGTLGAVAWMLDVTAESQLRRLQQNLVANVSHELRTPIAALSVMVQAIHDGIVSHETRQRYLAAVLAETERLTRLTDNLLHLSSIDAGMLEVTREPLSLATIFEHLQAAWLLRCASSGISFEVVPTAVRAIGDHRHVWQVLTNLLENAVRHTPAGGTIQITAHKEEGMVRVCVQDSGVGIAAEHLPRLWERFYKVDPARTRENTTGAGLGLSIVRHLVEQMEGRVQLESTPGRGSLFSFTLPAAP